MESKKIVLVNYTGKATATNSIFETTDEKKAVDAGIFDPKRKYSAIPIILGEGEMLKPIEEALSQMKTGEEKKIVLQPKEAFGERDQKLIGIVPLAEFQRRKISPVPGMVLDLNDRVARIQSVSGGRVRVDFNHPLAGKEIEYEIKIEKEINGQKEKIEAIFEKFFGGIPEKEKKLSIKENKVEINIDAKYAQAIAPLKKAFSDIITKQVKGIESVKFTEEFTKEEKKEDKETEVKKPVEKEKPKTAAKAKGKK